jgi:acetyl esterase/lipase
VLKKTRYADPTSYCNERKKTASGSGGSNGGADNDWNHWLTLLDLTQTGQVNAYCPRVMLIVAGDDPIGLQASCAAAHKVLEAVDGVQCSSVVFPGQTHGFVAYPPQVQAWVFGTDIENGCIAANRTIIRFIKEAC